MVISIIRSSTTLSDWITDQRAYIIHLEWTCTQIRWLGKRNKHTDSLRIQSFLHTFTS